MSQIIVHFIRASLERQAAASEDIAGPFGAGIITRAGFEKAPI
jgi:hypothetical protein